MTELTAGPPKLAQPYALTDEQIARYQRDGHTLLRAVCSPAEIAASPLNAKVHP